MSEQILHLTSNEALLTAEKVGAYHADSLSTEGFVHCSTASQILDVANTFYHGQHGLVLLVIDLEKLEADCKWESPVESKMVNSNEDNLFPHVYGPLNLDAVVMKIPFKPNADGSFSLPQELMT